LYTSPNIIRVVKLKRMRWVEQVAHMGKMRNAYKILVRKSEGKNALGRTKHEWEDNNKMELNEIEYEDVD
jgi:hypothetical protein